MKDWPTSILNQRGSFETVLILPLLLALTWGSALIALILIQRSQTEQASWVYAIGITHRPESKEEAREISRKSTGVSEENFILESRSNLLQAEMILDQSRATLPTSFRLALMASPPLEHKLTVKREIPDPLESHINFETPGDSFQKSRSVRQALWQEAMYKAGFGLLPLQLLGISELRSVIGFDLGGPAEEILTKAGHR